MAYRLIVSGIVEGRYRSYVADSNGEPVSPLFPSLAEVFPWMTANGYKLDEGSGEQFVPWRVFKN
jgi:hypothetical protein